MTTVQGMKVIYKDAEDKYIIPYTDVEYKLEKNYYTSERTDELLSEKADKATTLEGYGITDSYTKEETDELVNGVTVDLSDYYTKSETYSKSEVDEKLDDLAVGDIDLSDYYTKEQVDEKVGDIETILDNIIG